METEDAHNVDDVAERACQIAYAQGFAKLGDRVVITAGLPLGTPGATNLAARRLRHAQERLGDSHAEMAVREFGFRNPALHEQEVGVLQARVKLGRAQHFDV